MTTKKILQAVQDSIRAPITAIFEDLNLQMSTIGMPSAIENPFAEKKPIQPKPAKETVVEDKKAPMDIDFSLSDFKKNITPDETKPISLDALGDITISKYQRNLPNLQQTFFQALDLQFQKSLIPPPKKKIISNAHQNVEQNLDHLSLVSNEELDLQIILIQTESALLDANQDLLTLLCMRFEHILKHEIQATRLPIGPIAIGYAFQDAITQLEITLAEKKLIIKYLLGLLKNSYSSILEKANKVFIQHNILPRLTADDVRVRRKKDETKELAKEKRQKLLGITQDKDNADINANTISTEIAQFVQQIEAPIGAEQHFIKGNLNAPHISNKELASKISLLKSAPKKEANNNVYFIPDDSKLSLAEQLNIEANLDSVGLGKQESNTIGIMSLLFEDLLNNNSIPGPIKALLQQLRAPLLKAAVQDEMFFGDTENPAQKFFNEIAKSSLSWSPSKNPENDTFYKKMSSLVAKVNTDFEDDYLIFDDAIDDFDSFTEAEEKKTSKIEGRMVDNEVAQARHLTAREIANTHIDEKFVGVKLPSTISNFFHTTWRQVLFFIFNKTHSIDSEEWLDAIEVENSLLANLNNAEEDDIDIFLDILEDKLIESGTQEFEVKKQIAAIKTTMLESNDLTEDEIELIKNKNPDVSNIYKAEDVSSISSANNNADNNTYNKDDGNSDDKNESNSIIKKLHVGTWLQKNDQIPPIKIKIAAYIRFNDSYVMVLRNGMKDATFKSSILIQKIQDNEISIMNNTLIFDSALESVIGNIRE